MKRIPALRHVLLAAGPSKLRAAPSPHGSSLGVLCGTTQRLRGVEMGFSLRLRSRSPNGLLLGELAQLARALAWHARGHRFDSGILHQKAVPTRAAFSVPCLDAIPGQARNDRPVEGALGGQGQPSTRCYLADVAPASDPDSRNSSPSLSFFSPTPSCAAVPTGHGRRSGPARPCPPVPWRSRGCFVPCR